MTQSALRLRIAATIMSTAGCRSAVQVALLNNRGLQATLAELGVLTPNCWRPVACPTWPHLSAARAVAPTSKSSTRLHYSLARLLGVATAEANRGSTLEADATGSRRGSADTGLGDTGRLGTGQLLPPSRRYLAQVKMRPKRVLNWRDAWPRRVTSIVCNGHANRRSMPRRR